MLFYTPSISPWAKTLFKMDTSRPYSLNQIMFKSEVLRCSRNLWIKELCNIPQVFKKHRTSDLNNNLYSISIKVNVIGYMQMQRLQLLLMMIQAIYFQTIEMKSMFMFSYIQKSYLLM